MADSVFEGLPACFVEVVEVTGDRARIDVRLSYQFLFSRTGHRSADYDGSYSFKGVLDLFQGK